eukprot:1889206-Pleurochrysis_carterae.AAC.1
MSQRIAWAARRGVRVGASADSGAAYVACSRLNRQEGSFEKEAAGSRGRATRQESTKAVEVWWQDNRWEDRSKWQLACTR